MTDEELIKRLRSSSRHPMMDNNCKVDVFLVDDAADRIEQLVKYRDAYAGMELIATEALRKAEARAARLEAALKCLIEHCEITRDTAGYWKSQTTHQINPTQWKSWCKQIKFARASMEGEQQ